MFNENLKITLIIMNNFCSCRADLSSEKVKYPLHRLNNVVHPKNGSRKNHSLSFSFTNFEKSVCRY